jgi:hypothetical protein
VSKAFRFHGASDITSGDILQKLSKRKSRSAAQPTLIAADSTFVVSAEGRRDIESYAELIGDSFLTLTRKEADLIALANPGIRPPAALELIHPWLPKQVYREDAERNYEALKSVFIQYRYNIFSVADYCDKKWATVCNSVRRKTDMDKRFFTAWHLPIQDAYVLEEKRPDRCVIALDFNAMYPSCMQYQFPRPSKMRRVIYDREVTECETLPIGLYRCILQGARSNFIKRYNPFRSFFAGRHLKAALTESLLVDLNEFEVVFFRRHFEKIYVSEAVISDQSISHPLAREAKRCYARRTHFLSHGNKALADREKFQSTLLSSCTQRPGRLRQKFSSSSVAEEYLRRSFGISADGDDPARIDAQWLKGKKAIVVSETADGLSLDMPDIDSEHACFVFNQRIVARSRILLLEMMEKMLRIVRNAELCYANVDSLHFSLPLDSLDSVMGLLQSGASELMGGYKIEAIAKSGLWLEPGRYWLYSDEVLKFRNRSISHQGSAFTEHSIHVASRQIDDLFIPIRFTIGMDRSMSDLRSIEYDPVSGLERQCVVELGCRTSDFDVLYALELNRRHSIPRRIEAFRALAASLGTVGSRCLETQQSCQSQLRGEAPPDRGRVRKNTGCRNGKTEQILQ